MRVSIKAAPGSSRNYSSTIDCNTVINDRCTSYHPSDAHAPNHSNVCDSSANYSGSDASYNSSCRHPQLHHQERPLQRQRHQLQKESSPPHSQQRQLIPAMPPTIPAVPSYTLVHRQLPATATTTPAALTCAPSMAPANTSYKPSSATAAPMTNRTDGYAHSSDSSYCSKAASDTWLCPQLLLLLAAATPAPTTSASPTIAAALDYSMVCTQPHELYFHSHASTNDPRIKYSRS